MVRPLTEAEHMRRAEAIRAGHAAGQPMSQIAAGLGMSVNTLSAWYGRHGERLAESRPGTYPRRSEPIPPSDRLHVERADDGWAVECGPCGRRWARPTRRRAHDLAELHLRMHRPRPAPPPAEVCAEALALLATGHACGCGLRIAGTRMQIANAAAAHWDLSDCPWRLTPITPTTERP